MRTIIDLPEDQLATLGKICTQKNVSRAEIIRQAVAGFIQEEQSGKGENAFGLWKKTKVNALKHEDKLRAEWGRR